MASVGNKSRSARIENQKCSLHAGSCRVPLLLISLAYASHVVPAPSDVNMEKYHVRYLRSSADGGSKQESQDVEISRTLLPYSPEDLQRTLFCQSHQPVRVRTSSTTTTTERILHTNLVVSKIATLPLVYLTVSPEAVEIHHYTYLLSSSICQRTAAHHQSKGLHSQDST